MVPAPPGTIGGSNGNFTVSGSHTYLEEGTISPPRRSPTRTAGRTVASTAPAVWSTLPSTAVRHVWGATVTGPDGRIYIMGGGDSNGQFNTVEAYDPATATWTTVGAAAHAAAELLRGHGE